MTTFGELNFESSRAFADDEEEDISDSSFGLTVDWTLDGERYVKTLSEGSHIFCAFVGKVAFGFGEGFLKKVGDFTLLGQVFMTGNEGTIDLCSVRPKRRPAVRIYLGGVDNPVIFALIDFYGVPRFLSNELSDKLSDLINFASEVVIFHSEISAYNRGDEEVEGKLFFLGTSKFPKSGAPQGASRLAPPNLVSGPSASLLTHCEMIGKSGLLLITYCETELIDSISMQPFFQVVHNRNPLASGFNLTKIFSQFQHNIRHCGSDSNLYV